MSFGTISKLYIGISVVLAYMASVAPFSPWFPQIDFSYFPFVEPVGGLSGDREKAASYFAGMWLLAPFVSHALSRAGISEGGLEKPLKGLLILTLVLMPISLWGIWVVAYGQLPDTTGGGHRGQAYFSLMSHYTLGLGVLGGLLMLAMALTAYVFFIRLPQYWFYYFKKAG